MLVDGVQAFTMYRLYTVLNIVCVSAVCNTTLTEFSGVIESPNYPDTYESESSCEWLAQTTVGNTINASFSQLDLQPAIRGSCVADYVEVCRQNVGLADFLSG